MLEENEILVNKFIIYEKAFAELFRELSLKKLFSSTCKMAGIKEGGIYGLTLRSLVHSVPTHLRNGNFFNFFSLIFNRDCKSL